VHANSEETPLLPAKRDFRCNSRKAERGGLTARKQGIVLQNRVKSKKGNGGRCDARNGGIGVGESGTKPLGSVKAGDNRKKGKEKQQTTQLERMREERGKRLAKEQSTPENEVPTEKKKKITRIPPEICTTRPWSLLQAGVWGKKRKKGRKDKPLAGTSIRLKKKDGAGGACKTNRKREEMGCPQIT